MHNVHDIVVQGVSSTLFLTLFLNSSLWIFQQSCVLIVQYTRMAKVLNCSLITWAGGMPKHKQRLLSRILQCDSRKCYSRYHGLQTCTTCGSISGTRGNQEMYDSVNGKIKRHSVRCFSSDFVFGYTDFPSQAQVVICGGGVVGCAVALHLAMDGAKDVVLLEQGRLVPVSS